MPLTVVDLTDVNVPILIGNSWYVTPQQDMRDKHQKQEER
jgi:hypothetical protein